MTIIIKLIIINRTHLQLVLVKYAQQIVRDDAVESLEETVHLLSYIIAQPQLRQCVQVLDLGRIRHSHFGTVRYQVHRLHQLSPIVVDLLRKVQLHALWVVKVRLQDVFHFGQVQLRVVLLKVLDKEGI